MIYRKADLVYLNYGGADMGTNLVCKVVSSLSSRIFNDLDDCHGLKESTRI